MNQQFNNKFKLNGSVQFLVYDQNDKLIDKYANDNTVYYTGATAYKRILGFMDHPTQPTSSSIDDDYQVNLQSNPNDFLSLSGKTPFLQPITINKKKQISLQCAFRYDRNGFCDSNGDNNSSASVANNTKQIINKNAFAKNSDQSLTTISTNGNYIQVYNPQTKKQDKRYFQYGEKWIYVYDVPQDWWFEYQQIPKQDDFQSSSSSDSSSSISDYDVIPIVKKQFEDLYHCGLRVDIKGPQYETFHMQIAYDFQGKVDVELVNGRKNYNFGFKDLPQPIFPPLNGKPINRQFYDFQGGAITNDSVHSYFYDLFPRYCKIPKKIIFIFTHSSRNMDRKTNNDYDDSKEYADFDISKIQIQRIQFFRHTLPKKGPLAIYFQTQKLDKYTTNITQTTIKDNSVCYYASLGYKDANGMIFTKVGLANSTNNYKFVEETQVNYDYNNNKEQKLTDVKPNTTGSYFYRLQKANQNDCDNILTVADTQNWKFEKTSKNRIDIIYKMNIGFGD